MQQEEKKQIYIGPTIQHIQNSQLLIKNNNNLLLLNKRQLILLNLESQSIVTSKIDSQKVTSTTLHEILNIYLIKTQGDIFIVNEMGESLGKISFKDEAALMESRFIFILPMENGQCQDPHQRIDKLIYITDQNLHISNIKIIFERAMLKNKRITNFSLQLIKKQGKNNSIDPTIIFDAPQWIEKCKIFKQLGYFVCYNKNEIMVFKLPKLVNQTLELYLTYRKTSKSQNFITDVAISYRQKQIIFGHESGTIKIYRFNQTRKYLQELRGHQKQCHSLIISEKNNNDILYSSGDDNMIRIWNLYQFQEIYSLRIDLICDRITLLSDELAFVKFYDMRKTSLCKINAYKMEPIMTENKGGKVTSLKCDGQWGIALYSNNYAQMFLITNQHQNEHEVDPMEQINGKKPKRYIQKIQFPLKYGNVRSAKKLKKNQYAIILQKGFSMIFLDKDEVVSQNFQLKKLVYNQEVAQLQSDTEVDESDIDQMYDVHEENEIHQKQAVVKNFQSPKQTKKDDRLVQLIHQKLLGTYLFGTLQDWKGIPTAINVTFVTFVIGKTIPMWDVDQKRKNPQNIKNEKEGLNRKRKKSLIPDSQPVQVEQMIHVVLGTDRGVIYIVNILNRTQFQSRIVIHTQQIEYIKEFFPKKVDTLSQSSANDEIFFMSSDRNHQFCFWSISQSHPPNIYCRVTNHRDITHLGLHESFLLIGQKQGKVSILEIFYEQQKHFQNQDFLVPPSPIRRKQSIMSSRDLSVSSSSKLYFKVSKNDSIDGHMKKVTTGDYINYKNKNLFLTGSEDCIIKMWLGLEKILLFELKIFDTIEHMRFIHNGLDFLMVHNNQISVIKSQNIDEIRTIDSQLDTKYGNLKYFGFQIMSIRAFFMKENEIFDSPLKKPINFRLKMKHSLKIDLTTSVNDDPSYRSSIGGFSLKKGLQFQINSITKIQQQPKKTQQQQKKEEFLTKIQQKQPQPQNYLSPLKKITNSQQKEKKMKIYAKSQEKIKGKKSFYIASTAQSKQYNQAYFMLPKILSKNQSQNFGKRRPSASFQISSFLDQLKTQRQKAYSYFGRYSKK